MRLDKKSRGAKLRFILLDDLAKLSPLEDPPKALLEAAYNEVAR